MKKHGTTAFSLEASWDIRAFWNSQESQCIYYKVDGSDEPFQLVSTPAYSGYDTHRMAVWAYGRDAYQQTAIAFGEGPPR